jgi:formate dehydrogenase maturation protein FdhE
MHEAFVAEIFNHVCDSCEAYLQVVAQSTDAVFVVIQLSSVFLED